MRNHLNSVAGKSQVLLCCYSSCPEQTNETRFHVDQEGFIKIV